MYSPSHLLACMSLQPSHQIVQESLMLPHKASPSNIWEQDKVLQKQDKDVFVNLLGLPIYNKKIIKKTTTTSVVVLFVCLSGCQTLNAHPMPVYFNPPTPSLKSPQSSITHIPASKSPQKNQQVQELPTFFYLLENWF